MDLLKLNKKFYLKTQEYFNTSRQTPWSGWQKLLPYLRGVSSQVLKVLDLGCGNGRFGKFLSASRRIIYTGIDNNQYLLGRCRETLPQAKLINQDILKPWPIKEKFDLAVILGVMHHLPKSHRLKLLKRAAASLKPGGILFLSFWEFDKAKGKKIADNDYILSWKLGVTAKRYCHFYSQNEILQLIKPLKLKLLANYIADKSNRYLILRK